MNRVKEKDLVVGKYYYMSDNKINLDSFKYLKTTDTHIIFEYKNNNKDNLPATVNNEIRFSKQGWTYYED